MQVYTVGTLDWTNSVLTTKTQNRVVEGMLPSMIGSTANMFAGKRRQDRYQHSCVQEKTKSKTMTNDRERLRCNESEAQ